MPYIYTNTVGYFATFCLFFGKLACIMVIMEIYQGITDIHEGRITMQITTSLSRQENKNKISWTKYLIKINTQHRPLILRGIASKWQISWRLKEFLTKGGIFFLPKLLLFLWSWRAFCLKFQKTKILVPRYMHFFLYFSVPNKRAARLI